MSELKLISDQAILEGGDKKADGLGFESYAEVLASAAADTSGPFTIGAFGEWGQGKTSLLRMTREILDKRDNFVTVWFNAWRYEQEEHPIIPLVGTIIHELERHQSLLGELMKTGREFINSLRAVAYGFATKSKVKVPGFAEVEASFVVKDMVQRHKELTPDPLLDRSLFYEAFDALSKVEISRKLKIVVFIDDLDRCMPDRAIKLLESIKLVLSQPGFVFFLGVSRNVIEGYLRHRYTKEYGLTKFEGESYLDKIVQLPFYIPQHAGRMGSFSEKLLTQLDEADRTALEDVLPIIGVACGHNPRTTIRFVNNLLIDRAICAQLVRSGEMEEEIPLAYFAITRSLQQRWLRLFRLIDSRADLGPKAAEWTATDLSGSNWIDGSDPLKEELAKSLVENNDLRQLLHSPQGKAWLKDADQRKATIEFLQQTSGVSPEPEPVKTKGRVLLVPGGVDKETIDRVANLINRSTMPDSLELVTLSPTSEIDLAQMSQVGILREYDALVLLVGPGFNVVGPNPSSSDYLHYFSPIHCVVYPGGDPEIRGKLGPLAVVFKAASESREDCIEAELRMVKVLKGDVEQ